jgi:hypothetical protein
MWAGQCAVQPDAVFVLARSDPTDIVLLTWLFLTVLSPKWLLLFSTHENGCDLGCGAAEQIGTLDIQGDSVARDPKLLSIKYNVVEIMT